MQQVLVARRSRCGRRRAGPRVSSGRARGRRTAAPGGHSQPERLSTRGRRASSSSSANGLGRYSVPRRPQSPATRSDTRPSREHQHGVRSPVSRIAPGNLRGPSSPGTRRPAARRPGALRRSAVCASRPSIAHDSVSQVVARRRHRPLGRHARACEAHASCHRARDAVQYGPFRAAGPQLHAFLSVPTYSRTAAAQLLRYDHFPWPTATREHRGQWWSPLAGRPAPRTGTGSLVARLATYTDVWEASRGRSLRPVGGSAPRP
jgi:hypothetical protein